MAFNKCPKCGSRYIYIGATQIECGEDINCENWSSKQAKEVTKLFKEMEDAQLDDYGLPLPDFDDEDTKPNVPSLYFHTD